MPIEIKELLIKAVVTNTPKSANTQPSAADFHKLKKDLVKECVQEVLEKIKEKTER